MRKSISLNSFFVYHITRPLIVSYGNFLSYCKKNNITLSKKSRQNAIYIKYNKL